MLYLSEEVELTVDEAEFGMDVWRAFPDRLIGFVVRRHQRARGNGGEGEGEGEGGGGGGGGAGGRGDLQLSLHNNFSTVSSQAVLCHR